MFFVCKHAVFTLFALNLIKKQCDAVQDGYEALNVKKPKSILIMDKLEDFNMTYYCKFQANDRRCSNRRRSRKYFFDIKLQRCREFQYGYCTHSYNMFEGRRICLDSCRDEVSSRISDNVTANVYCRYQPDFGDCNLYYPSFYFDISEGKCKGFSYSGCGGNRNRFKSALLCSDVCANAVRHEEVTV